MQTASWAWRNWVRTIRNYASTDGARGAEEALILASGMEQYGCEFARTFEFGGCFSWDHRLGWEFKTLEFFCRQTCACVSTNMLNSECPRPFGLDCGFVLSNCMNWNSRHYCPGQGAVEIAEARLDYVPHDAGWHWQQVDVAVQRTLAHIAQVDPALVLLHHLEITAVYARIFLIDGQTLADVQERVDGYKMEDVQAHLDAQLVALGVLHELALNVTYCCKWQ